MGRTLLIGGMGFIGLHTARRFLDACQDVVVTFNSNRREPDFLEPDLGTRCLVEQLDVTDGSAVSAVMGRNDVDSVVYLAVPALAGVSPADEFRTNTQGYLNVLDAARELGIKRVSVTSSLAVYANVKNSAWDEDVPLPVASSNPTEAYKKALEVLGLFFGQRTGLDVIFLRVAGIFGPLYHSMANFPSRVCHAAARGKPVDFGGMRYGPPRANEARDHCYVKDCALGIQMLHSTTDLQHRIYNVGNGRATSAAELVAAVKKVAPDFSVDLQPGGDQNFMSPTRTASEVAYKPQFGIDGGIADYINWLKTHDF